MNASSSTPCSRQDHTPAPLRIAAARPRGPSARAAGRLDALVDDVARLGRPRQPEHRRGLAASPRAAARRVGRGVGDWTCRHRSRASACACRASATSAARNSQSQARAACSAPSGCRQWAWCAIAAAASASSPWCCSMTRPARRAGASVGRRSARRRSSRAPVRARTRSRRPAPRAARWSSRGRAGRGTVDRRAGERGHQVRVDPAPEDRCRGQRRAASSGSREKRWRSTSRMPSGTGRSAASTRAEVRPAPQEPGVLQDEERVAAGHVGDDRVQLRVVLPTEACSSSRTDAVSSPSSRTRSAPPEPGPPWCPRGLAVVASVVRRVHHDRDRTGTAGPGQVAEQLQRRGVGPVDVLEDQDQRLSRRPRSATSATPRRTSAARCRHPLRRRTRTVEQGPAGGRARAPSIGRELPDDTEPGPQRRRVVTFVAASDEHPDATRRRPVVEVVHEPRLPDARLAGDQQEAGRAGRARRPRAARPPQRGRAVADRPGRVPRGAARGDGAAGVGSPGQALPGVAPSARGPGAAPPARAAGSPPSGRRRGRRRAVRGAGAGCRGRRPAGRTGTARGRAATRSARGTDGAAPARPARAARRRAGPGRAGPGPLLLEGEQQLDQAAGSATDSSRSRRTACSSRARGLGAQRPAVARASWPPAPSARDSNSQTSTSSLGDQRVAGRGADQSRALRAARSGSSSVRSRDTATWSAPRCPGASSPHTSATRRSAATGAPWRRGAPRARRARGAG